ncbi:hypothetical protein [Halobacterium salinarum]|uniref:hypothetical protein n=1 Tax=Halobacterium salinarum TaxID=2242 RepID=UPI001F485114|nr:hypothetical protein [Halobacterium salinarum]MCF2165442.1 hypothetical protein [Halobacterium salinarum]MCF2168307.1 hypothetical protein [Halobacterium salinarum]
MTVSFSVDLDADVDGLIEQYDQIVDEVEQSEWGQHVEELNMIRRELDSRVGRRKTITLLI